MKNQFINMDMVLQEWVEWIINQIIFIEKGPVKNTGPFLFWGISVSNSAYHNEQLGDDISGHRIYTSFFER